MRDILFFNWANQPWAGKASADWQVPGMAFSASTHCILQDAPPLLRPKKMVFQNCCGRRGSGASGITALQLYAHDANQWVQNSQPELLSSFAVIAEIQVSGPVTGVSHSWHELTAAEIDKLLAVPFKYGLSIGVRHRSVDGIVAPVWHSSKLLVLE